MTDSTVETYRSGDTDLQAHVFGEGGATIVFFHGGGWRAGSPAQFEPQCRYLASRGMTAVAVQYRFEGAHAAVDDARAALLWARDRFGSPVAAGGGSAGGHMAACAAYIGEPRADACVLFNPVLDARVAKVMIGERWAEISPLHHVSGGPPCIVFHGDADNLVPIDGSRAFRDRCAQVGVRCDLVEFAGEEHGFFNYGRPDAFVATTRLMDEFLASLGWLQDAPTIGALDLGTLAAR